MGLLTQFPWFCLNEIVYIETLSTTFNLELSRHPGINKTTKGANVDGPE